MDAAGTRAIALQRIVCMDYNEQSYKYSLEKLCKNFFDTFLGSAQLGKDMYL